MRGNYYIALEPDALMDETSLIVNETLSVSEVRTLDQVYGRDLSPISSSRRRDVHMILLDGCSENQAINLETRRCEFPPTREERYRRRIERARRRKEAEAEFQRLRSLEEKKSSREL